MKGKSGSFLTTISLVLFLLPEAVVGMHSRNKKLESI